MTYEERWGSASLEQACAIWDLDTTKDSPNLFKLKDRLHDLKDYPLNHPLELARCYFDAKHKLPLAEQKFRAMVKWRKREGIDNLLQDFRPPALMEQYYPSCYLHGYDQEGDPIWIDRTGSSDVWAVYNHYGHEDFRDYVLRNREVALRGEFAREYEQRQGRPPARFTVIMDMDGLCRRHLNAGLISPLEEGIRHLQDYYGGAAKRILVTKAPVIFRIVWSIAQHFCNESLKKSITFCNAKNTQEILDLYIDREVLPPVFCQQGKGRPGTGFAQSTLEGGIMPKVVVPELKASDSGESVASCDSTVLETPPGSPRNSSSSGCETIPENRVAVVVRTTSLLKGYLGELDRVLVE